MEVLGVGSWWSGGGGGGWLMLWCGFNGVEETVGLVMLAMKQVGFIPVAVLRFVPM